MLVIVNIWGRGGGGWSRVLKRCPRRSVKGIFFCPNIKHSGKKSLRFICFMLSIQRIIKYQGS